MSLAQKIYNIVDYILPYRCISCLKLITGDSGICSDCFIKINFISDPYCQKCGTPFEFKIEGQVICGGCFVTPPLYNLARSLFKFDEYSKKIIHNFKYNDSTSSASFFAELMVARYKNDFQDIDIIVPVPMHRLKRIFRKYNPAQILANEIAKKMNVRMIPDLLIKENWTKAQTRLNKLERKKNLQHSIVYNQKYSGNSIVNKNILLVDDMRTTGATSDYCISILRSNKIKTVKLITIGST